MSSSAIHALGRSRLGAVRRALVALLGVAAVLVGLLAMHAAGSGAEHANVASAATAATAGHGPHAVPTAGAGDHAVPSDAASPTPQHPVVSAAIVATAVGAVGAVACDEECQGALGDCALMVIGCAMLLVLVAFVLVAGGPAVLRRLLDRGAAHVSAFLRPIPLHLHRPDLTVLSISRT